MKFRLFIVIGAAAYGFSRTGISGMFISLFILGFTLFLYYTIMDGVKAVGNFMRPDPPTVIYQDGSAIKGHPDIEGTARHPDPTRPDEDEFAGLLTYRIEKHYRQ